MSDTAFTGPPTSSKNRVRVFLRSVHRSTIVFCVIWFLLSALLISLGERTGMGASTSMTISDDSADSNLSTPAWVDWENWEHGWPEPYLVRTVEGGPSARWRIFEGCHNWRGGALLYDIIVLTFVGLTCALAWQMATSRGMRLLQFRIRTLLSAIALIGIGLAWWKYQVELDRDDKIKTDQIEAGGYRCDAEFVGPLLLRRIFDSQKLPCWRTTTVHVSWMPNSSSNPKRMKRLVPQLHSLRFLKRVQFDGPDPGMAANLFATIESAPDYAVSCDSGSDVAVEKIALIKGLKYLDLDGNASDESLQYISDVKSLETLSIADSIVSDQGMLFIPHLPRLRELDVSGTRISYQGLRTLTECKSLKWVDVSGTDITRNGVESLRVERPDLTILFSEKKSTSSRKGWPGS